MGILLVTCFHCAAPAGIDSSADSLGLRSLKRSLPVNRSAAATTAKPEKYGG